MGFPQPTTSAGGGLRERGTPVPDINPHADGLIQVGCMLVNVSSTCWRNATRRYQAETLAGTPTKTLGST